jgi:hypothetical protein
MGNVVQYYQKLRLLIKLFGLIKCVQNKCTLTEYLSDNFPLQNGLKEGDALSPLHFNFALEYAIRKVQENQVGPKLNGLLTYAIDVNLLENNI